MVLERCTKLAGCSVSYVRVHLSNVSRNIPVANYGNISREIFQEITYPDCWMVVLSSLHRSPDSLCLVASSVVLQKKEKDCNEILQ